MSKPRNTFEEYIETRFEGKLLSGSHNPDGKACILEAASQWEERKWTDSPRDLNTWDLRVLNDIDVDDTLRTEWMPKVYMAYRDCRSWPEERQVEVVGELVIETVRQIIGALHSLNPDIAQQCRDVEDVATADAAARAATAAARAARAATAARAAGYAADAAAHAATAATAAGYATDAAAVFVTTCKLWIKAAKEQPE